MTSTHYMGGVHQAICDGKVALLLQTVGEGAFTGNKVALETYRVAHRRGCHNFREKCRKSDADGIHVLRAFAHLEAEAQEALAVGGTVRMESDDGQSAAVDYRHR